MGGRKLRILGVGIRGLQDLLSEYKVCVAENGEKAIYGLEEMEFDLVITTLALDGTVSGAGVVRAFKEHRPATKVIVVSSLTREDVARITQGFSPDGFLTRPFDREALDRLIDEVCGGRPAILVVDDDPAVRSVLAALLTDDGWEVRAAESGEEAEAIIARGFAPILVVTDLHMSGMSGAVLTRHLKERFGLVVIGMTGASAPDEIEAFKEAGADLVLRKPLSWEAMENAIRKLLPGSAAALAS